MSEIEVKELSGQVKKLTARVEALERLLILPVEKPKGNERQGKQREPFQSRHALAVVSGR